MRDGRGRGRGGARALGHGDLRHLMLHLIAEQPRHGYELIRLIEELFHGAYTPSAGAIYPTLSQLEDMGLIAATAEEGRKRYAITEEGRAHMQEAHEAIEAARLRTHRSAREFAKAQIPQPVREAFGRIKHAVLGRHGQWSEEEIARVAALLNQAADGMEEGQ
ncbi:PadR family transcriptional regulator [Stenotrophomonas panacihumi]|uniref:PadR family transcriptional regulator n=2 Tax=Stenotrophomonas panacihumi TaxID=676599 RepID=A0A0R0ASS7_9GAMM|nr:PadR family transcriptional regulator [Stenotrophomonas panacihumi]